MNKGGRKKEEKKIDLKDLKKKWYPQLKSGKRYRGMPGIITSSGGKKKGTY